MAIRVIADLFDLKEIINSIFISELENLSTLRISVREKECEEFIKTTIDKTEILIDDILLIKIVRDDILSIRYICPFCGGNFKIDKKKKSNSMIAYCENLIYESERFLIELVNENGCNSFDIKSGPNPNRDKHLKKMTNLGSRQKEYDRIAKNYQEKKANFPGYSSKT